MTARYMKQAPEKDEHAVGIHLTLYPYQDDITCENGRKNTYIYILLHKVICRCMLIAGTAALCARPRA